MAIPLGRFLLDDVVGSGGAGIVFRGRHTRLDLPVAVKVLPPRADRLALHAHKNEVQAVARLHHAHVVAILDAGVVDAKASASSAPGASLTEGSPYLVVELASGGDLHDLRPPLPWGPMSDVLRTLLAALSHAHARGVVHKDLKPQNVLLCTDDDVRPGLKLTDFGLAMHERAERLDGGTPLFMAPEQFDADGRDLGPWTDLYALGCVAHWLATGAPPFVDKSWKKLAQRHTHERAPALPSSIDAPAGFGAWVARLLEKSPAQRYRCAADADAALAALDASRPAPPSNRLPDGLVPLHRKLAAASAADAPTIVRETGDETELMAPRASIAAPTLRRMATPHSAPVRAPVTARHAWSTSSRMPSPEEAAPSHKQLDTKPRRADESAPSSEFAGATTQPPPLDVGAAAPPSSWRAPQSPLPDLRLVDAGLSLWGLRPVPLVGREQERDALWSALLDVHKAHAPRLVALRGPSGVGKSRLAEWCAHRAKETGAALVLKATFQPIAGRADGLQGLVARHIGLVDVDNAQLALDRAAAWCARWLPGDDLTAPELCALAGKGPDAPLRDDRHGALIRFLSALCRERPLLVWLDDVQHGKEALALLGRVMADAPELAALFVVTAVDELLDDDAQARLHVLAQGTKGMSLPLGALDDSAHDELCARLLGGEAGGLADELRRRTEGNPLFAVHLVGDWVERGLVEVHPDGLALKPGTSPELPDALHALWDQRIQAALDDVKPALASVDDARVPSAIVRAYVGDETGDHAGDATVALELAAVLGSTVDLVEWEQAVKDAVRSASSSRDVSPSLFDDVVEALVRRGLARRTDAGFQFAHALVRGSVERRAKAGHRLAHHHATAAQALAFLWGTDTPAAAARIGRHLLAAGAAAAALTHLLTAARAALDEGDALEAASLLADWERARDKLRLGDGDVRTAPGLMLQAQLAHAEGRHADACTLAARCVDVLRDEKQRAAALRLQASSVLAIGDLSEAEALYDAARRASAASNDELGVGQAVRGLGDVAFYRGDKVAAAAFYEEVGRIFQGRGRHTDVALNLWNRGYVEIDRGRLKEAKKLFVEMRKECRAARDRLGEANAENALGELLRRVNKLDEAEEHYRRANRIAQKSGLSRRWTFRINQAHTRVLRGDVAGAHEIALELLQSNAAQEPLIACSSWWIVALDAAVKADVTTWDRAVAHAIDFGTRGVIEDDMLLVATKAGDAMRAFDVARAEKAFGFVKLKKAAMTNASA